jgi:Tol biopolymer transport system component
LRQLTEGMADENTPSVSPDGKSILFAEDKSDYDIVSMSIVDGSTQPLVVTARSEELPAWAERADSMVYVSDRRGNARRLAAFAGRSRPPRGDSRELRLRVTAADIYTVETAGRIARDLPCSNE